MTPTPASHPSRFWLETLELINYRRFRQITINLDPQLTVLIARNGAGKTAVLDAIAVVMGTFVGSFQTGKDRFIDASDVRLRETDPALHLMEPQFPAVIAATGKVDGEPIQWARALNSLKSRTTRKEAEPLTRIGNRMQHTVMQGSPVLLPLIAYYGTGRLWNQKKKTEKKVFESSFFSRTAGYQDCNDPASSFKYFVDWFQHAAEADFEHRSRRMKKKGETQAADEPSPFEPLIDAIRTAVDDCLHLTGWTNLHWSFTHKAVVMEHPVEGLLTVEQLSDGVRNMIALVADIAYRMIRLNSDLGRDAVEQTPGLVLIDEVDMHLHPEWQQVVLHNLLRAFPGLQFVVTTHSPQVLSGLHRQHIRILEKNLAGDEIAALPLAESYGRSNADVMQSIMEVSPEPRLPETETLKHYMAIIEQGDWRGEETQALREKLTQTLGADHPYIIRADQVMRRRQALEG